MAADADALAKRLALGGSELRFLLVHHKVSDEIQCELYQNGIDSIAKFAASATDEADLKQMLKDSFSIDPSASLKLRAQGGRRRGGLENRYSARRAPGGGRSYK